MRHGVMMWGGLMLGLASLGCGSKATTVDSGTAAGSETTTVGDSAVGTGGASVCTGTGVNQGDLLGDFELQTCDGTKVTFGSVLKGKKAVILDFAAGWCAPCREHQPALVELYSKYSTCGLDVVVVLSEQDQPNDPATKTFCQTWKDQYKEPFTVLIDPTKKVTSAYLQGGGLPAEVIVDPQCKAQLKSVGKFSADEVITIQELTGCQ